MQQTNPAAGQTSTLSRRLALGIGTAAAGGLVLARNAVAQQHQNGAQQDNQRNQFPVREMQNAIGAEGEMKHGLLHFAVERKDLTNITGRAGARLDGQRIPFRPAWTLNGDFWFQDLGNGQAITNCDFCFRPEEINPAIDAMAQHGLVLMAFHQHFMGLNREVFFMHFRGTGNPLALARGIGAVLDATATPRPQQKPQNPQTPLNHQQLAHILGGHATVGDDGTVAVLIPRRNQMMLGGHRVSPFLHVAANCRFEPLDNNGHVAAVAPDFSMATPAIMQVMEVMRRQGWAVHCLYNQETGEHPQLFYSHQLKVGNPYQLAQEVRRGLNQMDVVNYAPNMARGG